MSLLETPPRTTAGLSAGRAHVDLSRGPEIHNRAPWNNVLCGALVFASRWAIAPSSPANDWNLFFTGIAIAGFAFCTLIAHGNVTKNYWSFMNVVAGSWLIASAWLIPGAPAVTPAQVCLGIVTISIALTSLANEHML